MSTFRPLGDDEMDMEFAERVVFWLRDLPASEQIPFLSGVLGQVGDAAYWCGRGDGLRSANRMGS